MAICQIPTNAQIFVFTSSLQDLVRYSGHCQRLLAPGSKHRSINIDYTIEVLLVGTLLFLIPVQSNYFLTWIAKGSPLSPNLES